jgi:AraC-like DNA-binding protein
MKKNLVIEKTLDYIEQNLEGDLSLDIVAGVAGYSKFHLNRVFQEYVGITICKYIQLRRLSLAARRLAEGEDPIINIAYDAGYASHQAFTYAFRLVYGRTPRQYRAGGRYSPMARRLAAHPSRTTMMGGIAA